MSWAEPLPFSVTNKTGDFRKLTLSVCQESGSRSNPRTEIGRHAGQTPDKARMLTGRRVLSGSALFIAPQAQGMVSCSELLLAQLGERRTTAL